MELTEVLLHPSPWTLRFCYTLTEVPLDPD